MEAWSLKRACAVGVEASVFPGLPVLCSVITMPQMYIPHNILLSCTGLHLLTILKSNRSAIPAAVKRWPTREAIAPPKGDSEASRLIARPLDCPEGGILTLA